ncbi:MAG: helix-turn-helix transcriptional regulator [Alphaproteobacteria bacterium]|nr:helix-turn-helix transcriptional regulator [Alphaproteobacteria bacterium]
MAKSESSSTRKGTAHRDSAPGRSTAWRNTEAVSETPDFLHRVGERVRAMRARRGMTRKILARDCGVSERYLAQLEGGHGNISIDRLRQVAKAMNVPVADLVREGPEQPIELTLLLQFLERLSPPEIGEAHRLLVPHFGGVAQHQRQARIALIGMRGAGKSTLGHSLAAHLDVAFVEMGGEIERESGISLNEIFSLYGQGAYRRYERRALERILETCPQAVIATGGSLVSEPGTYELLLNNCYTIWIKTSPEEHMARVVEQGDFRPMGDSPEAMDDLRGILAGREPLYTNADAIVDTAGQSIEHSVAALIAKVSKAGDGAT